MTQRPAPDRFDRQVRFAALGAEGQRALEDARVLVVGCGALGGVLLQELARSGVGELVLVDRDVVELTNLPRQVLFEERHAAAGTLKVEAARESLERIGGPTRFVCRADHLDALNVGELAEGCALVLDGTDNMPTRYLLNDFCVERGVPWVYGGVVGASGLVMPVIPGVSACLRCVFEDPPPPGTLDTCDSAGVLLPAVAAIASLQAGFALRILAGRDVGALAPAILSVDVWEGEMRRLSGERRADCPCCGAREFPFLHAPPGRRPVVLCGRNTVQVPGDGGRPDFAAVAKRLATTASELVNLGALMRLSVDGFRVTLFPDGRALVEGTDDVDRARALYDRLFA